MRHSGSFTVSSMIIGLFLALSAYMVVRHLRKPTILAWFECVAKMTEHQKSGMFSGVDKNGTPLTFEWEKTESGNFPSREMTKNIIAIGAQAYASIYVSFLRKHPEALLTIEDWKIFKPALEPLFQAGIDKIDWSIVEEKIRIKLHQLWEEKAARSNREQQQMIIWTVVVKDKTGPLGFIQFSLFPEWVYGSIDIPSVFILPGAQHRGPTY